MKRVLLMTVFGLVLAANAMADMHNARFVAYWKPNNSGGTILHVGPNDTAVEYGQCPNVAAPSDMFSPNWSPNWNANTVESDTTAAKVFNPVPCTSLSTVQPSPISPPNGTPGTGSIYVLVGRAGLEGISGVSFGVDWTPTTFTGVSTTFNYCIDGQSYPNAPPGTTNDFPRRGGGVRATWATCQNQVVGGAGVHAVIGYFRVTQPPNSFTLQLTPNNNLASGIPELSVADCASQESNLYTFYGAGLINQVLGRVGFGTSADGYNPCSVTPTRKTTWGKIKSTYN